MSELVFYAAVCSDVGNNRKNNEDNYNLLGHTLREEDYFGRRAERSAVVKRGVVAVFDGMGGQDSGEVASMSAAQMLSSYREDLLTLEPEEIEYYANKANEAICASMANSRSNMGSTMAVAAIADGYCTTGNIGDSRIYLCRGGELQRLSEDHTVVEQLVRMQMLTEEEAAHDKRRHQLTQHLGISADEMALQPHITPCFELQSGDRLLLCSDGVTDALSDDDLLMLLSQDTGCDKMAGGIVDSAMLAGSPDNVTALVVKVGRRSQNSQTQGAQDQETRQSEARSQSRNAQAGSRSAASAKKNTSSKALYATIWAVCGVLAFAWGAIASLLR